MDSYYDHGRHEVDVVQMEKAKAMRRYRTFQKVTHAVRTLEIFVAIMVVSWSVSWSSAYFPAAVKLAGEFLRRAFSLICSPHFVFVLGNVIVITLFAKSGDTAAAETTTVGAAGDDVPGEEIQVGPENVEVKCEIETVREKEVAVVAATMAEGKVKEEEVEKESDYQRVYRRTRSAVERVVSEKRELRRSATETRRKVAGDTPVARMRSRMFDEDDLSGDEFRRKVEEFIEKQQRALREESKAIVLSTC